MKNPYLRSTRRMFDSTVRQRCESKRQSRGSIVGGDSGGGDVGVDLVDSAIIVLVSGGDGVSINVGGAVSLLA